jgi:hypothetical protein
VGAAHRAELVARGWTLIPGTVDPGTLEQVRASLDRVYPSEDQLYSNPESFAWVSDGQFGGLKLWPLDDPVLDLLPVDDRVVAVAEELLGTRDIRLLRAGYQAKYAGTVDFAQVLHYDYPNHSLVVPHPDDILNFFLYLSDVTEELGPTMLVSDRVRGSLTPELTHPTREQRPDLYELEESAAGPAGSLLAFRTTTYHRGSAFKAPFGTRVTLGLSYGRPAAWRVHVFSPARGRVRLDPVRGRRLAWPASTDRLSRSVRILLDAGDPGLGRPSLPGIRYDCLYLRTTPRRYRPSSANSSQVFGDPRQEMARAEPGWAARPRRGRDRWPHRPG